MGFDFHERPGIDVSGKRYEVDLADVGFIEAVVTDFSGLIREYDTLSEMREQIMGEQGLSAEAANDLANRLTGCNGRLVALSRGFIEKTLGVEAYSEIFTGRRPNSAEHIELCAYIYEAAVKSREGVVSNYVLPQKTNGRTRRAAKRSDSGSKKCSD